MRIAANVLRAAGVKDVEDVEQEVHWVQEKPMTMEERTKAAKSRFRAGPPATVIKPKRGEVS